MPRGEADAHGLDPRLGQLIVEAPSYEEPARRLLASALAAFFEGDNELALLIIGPFENGDVTTERLGTRPVASLGGMNVYQVGNRASVMGTILSIEAEELAMFGCPASHLRDFIARIEDKEAKWWKPGSTTLRGALTKAPDLVNLVAYYSASHSSIELLGAPAVIKRCAERACSLA